MSVDKRQEQKGTSHVSHWIKKELGWLTDYKHPEQSSQQIAAAIGVFLTIAPKSPTAAGDKQRWYWA